ncbi:MAG: hypothetical protein HC890_17390 [Chloroflexaceae bacterium]|nr:hypothetical protein [Chloroflexaceae bacterium]
MRRLGCTDVVAALKALPPDHWEPDAPLDSRFDTQFNQRAIAWLWQEKYLELEQLKTLFNAVIQEAIESLLWLTQGTFCWSPTLEDENLKALELDLPFLELPPLLESLQKRLAVASLSRNYLVSPPTSLPD